MSVMSSLSSTPFLAWHVKFVKAAITYNLVVFLLFLGVYTHIDFEKHFEASANHKRRHPKISFPTKLYFAVMTHTAIGSNDITPRTDFARQLTAAHALLAWMQMLVVFMH